MDLLPYQQQLIRVLQKQAANYKKSAVLFEEVGQRLVSRLMYFRSPPQKILDLGCAQGSDSQLLAQAYPEAEITAIDFCHQQFQYWPSSFSQKIFCCVANAAALPLPNQTFNLLFANLLLPAIIDYQAFWQECLRVLQPGGILLFSSLGSETLKELRECFVKLSQQDCINIFPNMHDIGDGLAGAGFSDPAIESEKIELHYSTLKKLLTDLKQMGSIKIWDNYPHVYKSRLLWKKLADYYQQHFSSTKKKLIATAEIYYGIAFAPIVSKPLDDKQSFSIANIKRR